MTNIINQNLTVVRTPGLIDLLELFQNQILLDLNCHHLGTIQSFDATTQTAQVTINYKKTFFKTDSNSNSYSSYLTDYPLITSCPVIVLGGGGTNLTFPIKQGDQCVLLFNDRDIDNWFNGSSTSANATPALHAFTDCIALVGLTNSNSFIQNYDTVRTLITNGTAMIGINPVNNKLTLTNGTSLNTLLQQLCTQLENLTIALAALTVTGVLSGGATSGPPANAAIITNIGTQITIIATNIGLLIE